MILGLPWQTWLLAIAAVVPGLALAWRLRRLDRE